MVQVVVSVFDSAAGLYGRPVFVPATGQAIRSFTDEVNRSDPANDLNKHPEDFVLYRLAMFDDTTGRFVSDPDPLLLVRGKDVASA